MKDDSRKTRTTSTSPPHIVLSVLLFQEPTAEGTAWVAQGLEHDLAAQGPTMEQAQRAFLDLLTTQWQLDQRRDRPPLEHLPQAPAEYWDAFERAWAKQLVKPHELQRVKASEAIPPAYMVQAITDKPVGLGQ